MNTTRNATLTRQKTLRLRPGVVAVLLLWTARFGLNVVIPGEEMAAFRLPTLDG